MGKQRESIHANINVWPLVCVCIHLCFWAMFWRLWIPERLKDRRLIQSGCSLIKILRECASRSRAAAEYCSVAFLPLPDGERSDTCIKLQSNSVGAINNWACLCIYQVCSALWLQSTVCALQSAQQTLLPKHLRSASPETCRKNEWTNDISVSQ